jgi:hypothetical protein
LPSALHEVLDAAVEVTQAHFGNIQLLGNGTLRIAAERGFNPKFLEYFNQVHEGEAACGTAMKTLQRVIVQDVACDPIFQNPRTIEVLLATGVRAVQSTPLIGCTGMFLGMLSTHYRTPHIPPQHQLQGLMPLRA